MRQLIVVIGLMLGGIGAVLAQKTGPLKIDSTTAYLYRGVEYHFSVPEGTQFGGCKGGKAYRVDGPTWRLVPIYDSMTVYLKQDGVKRAIGYPIQRKPDPIITVAGLEDGTVTAATLRAQLGLVVRLPKVLQGRCKVVSYRCYYTPKNQTTIEFYVEGARFTGAVRRAIDHAKPGDQFVFTKIRAYCYYDGMGEKINSIQLRVR